MDILHIVAIRQTASILRAKGERTIDDIFDLGGILIRYLQMASPTLDAPMLFFSFLGTVEFYLLLITFIYWLVNPRLGIRVFVVLVTTATATNYLKQLLHQPRPYWLGLARSLSTESFRLSM